MLAIVVIITTLIIYLYTYETNVCDLTSDIKKINKLEMMACINKSGYSKENIDEIKRRIILVNPNQTNHRTQIHTRNKISVKTSSLSGDLLKKYEEILTFAKKHNTFVWMSAETTDINQKNIAMYTELIKEFDNIGITIQAYHNDSISLAKQVLNLSGHIRLVKGLYIDGKSKQVWDNYKNILEMLINDNGYHEVATHNFKLLEPYVESINKSNINYGFAYINEKYALKNCKKLNIPPDKCSFYLAYGRPYNFVKGYLTSMI